MLNRLKRMLGRGGDTSPQPLPPTDPLHIARTFEAAMAAFNAGQFGQAQAGFLQTTQLDGTHADAYHLLGIACIEQGKIQEAEHSLRRAVELKEHAAYVGNLGLLMYETKRLSQAEIYLRRAVELDANHTEALGNLANVLRENRRFPEAEQFYRRALELNPSMIMAHNNLGLLLKDTGRLQEAEASLRRALSIHPQLFDTHNNLGVILHKADRLQEAETCFRLALEINPRYATANDNLGLLLRSAGRWAEAEAAHRRAIALNPDFVQAYNNLGILYLEIGRLEQSAEMLSHALSIQPDCPQAKFNLALTQLAQGNYAKAWALHEVRYDTAADITNTAPPELPFPQWQGEPLTGKTLLLWPEQGRGDYIQFIRYAPLLKAKGLAGLSLYCLPHLRDVLLTGDGVDRVVTDPTQIEMHDYWAFPMSLPLHFDTELDHLPARLPYLHALPERVAAWQPRLTGQGLKVGLVWKGNPDHRNDKWRSLPGLETLAPLWKVPGIRYFSLQKWDDNSAPLSLPAELPMMNLAADIQDFADTAAIIEQLDLLICVDTAVAHLAGALNKPCWVLLSGFATDWRWLQQRDDTPWYPKALRLFRQPLGDDWTEVVENLSCDLSALAESWRAKHGDALQFSDDIAPG